MKLSIVSTLYKTAEYIDEFYKRITKTADLISTDYEVIFVNDGSPDDSVDRVLSIREKDKRVKLIDLSRNFGHHRAIMTGLEYANGETIFLIDSDLEEEPELLKLFWDLYVEDTNIDVVYGVQEKRKGGFWERVSGTLFYKIYNYLTEVPVPENFLTVRIMSKRYIKELCRYDERVMQFSVLSELTGFIKKEVVIKKSYRRDTTYCFKKRIQNASNAITSTSVKPLIWIFRIGVCLTLFSMLYILKIVISTIIYGVGVDGWASLIVSIWFVGGVLMTSLGVVGIYLSKIFIEVKKRPLVSIKNIHME